MNHRRPRVTWLVPILAVAPLAHAGEAVHAAAPLSLDLAAAYASIQPPAAESGPAAASDVSAASDRPAATDGRERRFGRAGSQWWSIGPGIANDFGDNTDLNLHGLYSVFLADSLEFGVEAAGWYFNQKGPDTGGVSGSMLFRWHFYHWDEQFKWGGGDKAERYRSTLFFDIGIGLLAGFDDVPDEGTSLNFLPRAGAGFTHALTDDDAGARLTMGVRWHHISNARIQGDENNPARDGLMFYAEIQFPF